MHPHFHLYVACAHVPTHAEPSPNVGSWTANTDCGPYICLSFFVLCKLKLLLERQTQTATHLTRKDASLLISRSHSFCAVLCVWTGIFSLGVIIVLMRKKRKKKEKEKQDKRRLFGRTGLNVHCLLSQWQPRTISAYGSLWGTRTITTAKVLTWLTIKGLHQTFYSFPSSSPKYKNDWQPIHFTRVNKLIIYL